MDAGLQQTDAKCEQMAQENANMPDFSALTNAFGSLHSMGQSAKGRQAKNLAAKLGVEFQDGDDKLGPNDLSAVMVQRAQQAGKTEAEIQAALAGWTITFW